MDHARVFRAVELCVDVAHALSACQLIPHAVTCECLTWIGLGLEKYFCDVRSASRCTAEHRVSYSYITRHSSTSPQYIRSNLTLCKFTILSRASSRWLWGLCQKLTVNLRRQSTNRSGNIQYLANSGDAPILSTMFTSAPLSMSSFRVSACQSRGGGTVSNIGNEGNGLARLPLCLPPPSSRPTCA